jgi:hypothetical protein
VTVTAATTGAAPGSATDGAQPMTDAIPSSEPIAAALRMPIMKFVPLVGEMRRTPTQKGWHHQKIDATQSSGSETLCSALPSDE